ncbi:MAG: peptidase [Nitrosopumilaceae archaeon]|uniref:Peptidase n=1 Tax=Candidatus Nitrosomaritimum aestuariumsis TaxID=3342354 RepID=A0AC60WBQ7_9ARCH|nr:peptidase [Nitrosopumilaceae archaeon]
MCIGLLISVLLVPSAFADVFIPSHEYLGYFDSEGIYTVVGNVKNENSFAVIPTITVSVKDGDEIISKTIQHVPLASEKEIPFKVKFFEVSGNIPVLIPAELSYEKLTKAPIPIEILYDNTLIKHKDGHITGRIQNTGDATIYYPKIYAVVHGYERVLDIVQNLEYIEKIEPGEILDFSMYPDPSVTEDVFYYSCFAPVDTTVVPLTAQKEGQDFDFRYDSGAWYSAAKFDEKGTTLTVRGYNSYPLETYANFEFPPISGNEKFDVTVNDEPIDFIQSIDDMGFWHVAFTVGPTSQGVVKISGFEKGLPPEMPKVPQWIKINAEWWATEQISDVEFLEGVDFLFEKGIIFVPSKELKAEVNWQIPSWYKTTAAWWAEDKITDDDFLFAIENLVAREIIII